MFNKEDISTLSTIREKEEKNLKNLLSRKHFDIHELDEIMNPDLY